MARLGIDKLDIRKARAQLLSQGLYPSADAVRVALGNTGSKSTIHRYLRELAQEDGQIDTRQANTAKTIQNLVDTLAASLHADAEASIAALRLEHAAALQVHVDAKTALQAQVQSLQFQIQQLEVSLRNSDSSHGWQAQSASQKREQRSGFGIFGMLVNNNRDGRPGWSSLNLLSNNRSSLQEKSW